MELHDIHNMKDVIKELDNMNPDINVYVEVCTV